MDNQGWSGICFILAGVFGLAYWRIRLMEEIEKRDNPDDGDKSDE
jgi:hypothetical protein